MRLTTFLLFLFSSLLTVRGQVFFIENKGQWEKNLLYKADLGHALVRVEKQAILYTFLEAPGDQDHGYEPGQKIKGHTLRVEFAGSDKELSWEGQDIQEAYHNYFIGDDPSRWASRVPLYGRIYARNIWPGIDLELYSPDGQNLKYNLIVHPGADPSLIRMRYLGAEHVRLIKGRLEVETSINVLAEEPPVAFQENAPVACHYQLNGNLLSYRIGNYNSQHPLIIDPVVVFSSYTGSFSDNFGYTATYDFLGHAYAGGDSRNDGYPVTPGAFQATYGGGISQNPMIGDVARDCGIMKFAPDGRTIRFATYIGGSGNEQPHSMVVDNNNNLIVMGTTTSGDMPKTGNGFAETKSAGYDIFLIKISADGTQLLGFTYLGGQRNDGLNGRRQDFSTPSSSPLAYNFGDDYRGEVIVDAANNVYIASVTESSQAEGFPVRNSFNTTFGGNTDGCVFKLTPNLTDVIWGTYIGGPQYEAAYGLALDASGNVFACGGTSSPGNAIGANSLTTSYQGGTADGFIVKISPNGVIRSAATYVGTNAYDQCYFVQVDKFNQVYAAGQTAGDFPVVGNNLYSHASGGQFIVKLSNDLQQQLFSSKFGIGNVRPQISLSAFLVDSCERIFISGWGGESNTFPRGHGGSTSGFPVTSDAYQRTTDGSDFYLAVFSRGMKSLLYGSFFGGGRPGFGNELSEHVDGGTSRFDAKGIVYQSVCGGCGGGANGDFPTTPGAFSRRNNSVNCNNAIFKLDFENLNHAPEVKDTVITVVPGELISFNLLATDSDAEDTLIVSIEGTGLDDPAFPQPAMQVGSARRGIGSVGNNFSWRPGCQHISNDTFFVRVKVTDIGCPDSKSDSATIKIVVLPPPVPEPPGVLCLNFMDNDRIRIIWNEPDTSGFLQNYVIIRRIGNGPWQTLDTVSKNDTTYIDENAFNNSSVNYCYSIFGLNLCEKAGDSSYVICTLDQLNNPIQPGVLFTTTVVENKYLETRWFTSSEPDFKGYVLLRRENLPGSDYSIYREIAALNDTILIDRNVDVARNSYCYTLTVRDKCGNLSVRSRRSCSIVLNGVSLPYEHQLDWNDYEEWENGTQTFELKRKDDRNVWSPVYNNSSRFFSDTTLDYDWGGYWYEVVAYENGGNQAISTSNTVYLIQKPLLHVPTSFTPNGDRLNDLWGIVDVFVKDYHLLVYNRWGQKVVDTHDKNFQWDGYLRNEDPFDNVFIWIVYYTGWDYSKHNQKGTVTILR